MKIEEVAALLELVEQLEEIGNEDAVLGRVLIQTAQAIRVMLGEIQRLTPLESMRSLLCDALGLPADSAPETVAKAVEARRVVVPELTNAMVDLAVGPTLASIDAPGAPIRSAKRNGYRYGWRDACACLRTIPADRVLGDGMVQVRLEWLRDVLALLMDFDNAPAPVSTSKRLYALLSAPEALVPNNRANQGGAEHV